MKTVSITSGKGGVGKSSIAVNLGLELARRGKRVLLFDADLGLANIDILLDFSCQHTLADVVDGTRSIADVLQDGPWGLKVLSGGSGILKLERLTQAQRIRIAMGLDQLSSSFDVLLVDTGAGLSENAMFFNASVDVVTVVTTPEPTALMDAYAVIKILHLNGTAAAILVFVNRVDQPGEGAAVFARLEGVCQRFLDRPLRYAGSLSRDPAMEESVRLQKPVVIGNAAAPSARDFAALADRFDDLVSGESLCLRKSFWQKLLSQHSARV